MGGVSERGEFYKCGRQRLLMPVLPARSVVSIS